jgi:hypothetical protein
MMCEDVAQPFIKTDKDRTIIGKIFFIEYIQVYNALGTIFQSTCVRGIE